jgi:hypothetical protein
MFAATTAIDATTPKAMAAISERLFFMRVCSTFAAATATPKTP